MSKLFIRAKSKLTYAEIAYHKFSEDDVFIDDCCYFLQQCIELTLKYIVELHGEEYAENHEIRSNLNKLDRLGVEVPCAKEMRDMASTLYDWETKPRYNDDFVATKADIDDAFKIARQLVAYADALIVQQKNESLPSFPDRKL